MSVPTRRILDPIFGAPVLRYQGKGMAGWCKENSVSQWQKGSGWTANLYGGVQTSWDDWAAAYIPVDEVFLKDLKSSMWSYYMTEAEAYGVNMVIWVHDPHDFNKRAEITQLGDVSGLGKTTGWNSHDLDITTDQFSWSGEDWSGSSVTALTGSDLTTGSDNLYGLDDFQSDALFFDWTIYRISYEYGWATGSNEFKDVWLAEVEINGQRILLKPGTGERAGGETKYLYKGTTGTSTTRVTLVSPAATKRIRIHSIYMVTASASGSTFELYFGAETDLATNADKAIALVQLDTDAVSSESIQFGNDGPLGIIGDVVSMRTGSNITTFGSYVITYHEE